jgi:NADPH:quinone reductase-like Zn-dependent oxidoreductase
MDITQREGNYPPPPGASSILGVEFSGNVVEVGPNTSDCKVGSEVFGLVGGVSFLEIGIKPLICNIVAFQGAYAEYVVCWEKLVIQKPSHLTWVEAASIPENYLTGTYFCSSNTTLPD